MPVWVEPLLRIVIGAVSAYLAMNGHQDVGVSGIVTAALGDIPFRATSTGLSAGRVEEAKKVAEQVVVENVQPAAIQPGAPATKV